MADDHDLEADVRWSAKGRALLALLVPFFAWLAWYSFTSETQPSAAAGCLAIGMGVGALVVQVHVAVYRVRVGAGGITERSLRGTRHVPWRDVRKVELVGQARVENKIVRWAATPEEAFHVIVHAREGRVAVHRWMTGVDDFIAALGRDRATTYREGASPALARDDTSAPSALAPSRLNAVVNRAGDGLALFQAVAVALPLSFVFGLVVALRIREPVTGSALTDGVLAALAPWGLAIAAYKGIERVRRARFGAARARPRIGVRDFILSVAAAMAGPLVLAGFVPRALAPAREGVDLVLVAVGAALCWVPFKQVRQALRE